VNQLKFNWQAIFALLLLTACTKIETTTLGSELIPVVDNVNTFDTTLSVIANTYVGEEEYRLNGANPHVVGGISQDPVFGSSKATMFFQMKPSAYPFTFATWDSLQGAGVGFDSAVLILDYISYYGDSNLPTNLKLFEAATAIHRDTAIKPYYNLDATGLAPDRSVLWGSTTVSANKFKDSIAIKRGDSTIGKVANQLRIRLNDELARALFFDTASLKSDSLFQIKYHGFALEADANANTLFYFVLNGGVSKLEFYYRKNPKSNPKDITSSSFSLTASSGHAVKYETNRNGSEVASALIPDPVNGQDDVYVQTSPGISVKIKIPGLSSFKLQNRLINRAELRITQLPNAQGQLTPPKALYLDLIDTTSSTRVYKGIPYDLSPLGNYYCFPPTGINFSYFGGVTQIDTTDGKKWAVYKFNISRYIQSVVTRNEPIYDLRLSAPFYMFYENCSNSSGLTPPQVFPFTVNTSSTSSNIINPIGRGRMKLAGGTKDVSPEVRMQLRIIYTTL
jgi:hypothetical protein